MNGCWWQSGDQVVEGKYLCFTFAIADTVQGVTHRSQTSTEALYLLKSFWRRVWDGAAPAGLTENYEHDWQEQPQQTPRWNQRVAHVTAEALHACAQKAKHSSAGPDGITGEDLAYMPIAFWQLLLERLQHWQAQGVFPEVWQHCRTVFIAKDGPAKQGGSTEASRMRSISVFIVECTEPWSRLGVLTPVRGSGDWRTLLLTSSMVASRIDPQVRPSDDSKRLGMRRLSCCRLTLACVSTTCGTS